ncbi:MAG: hypothetical protein ACRD5M_13080 [Candidatus Acidiferrales bacterium]
MIIVLIKAILIVAVVPALITVYLGTADKLKTEKWPRRWIWNFPFWILLVAIVGVSALEVWSYERSTPAAESNRPLHFLPLESYEKELDSFKQKSSDWEQRRQELVRKFEFAAYAYDRQDYAKSVNALSEIEKGEDTQGPLTQTSSYVVANDLACAYFKRQRNHGFSASRFLFLAQSRVPPNSKEARMMEENIAILDELVNRLD